MRVLPVCTVTEAKRQLLWWTKVNWHIINSVSVSLSSLVPGLQISGVASCKALGHMPPLIPIISFLPRCMECRRGLAMRILSVCPSVCLSVTHVNCDKTVERSVQIFIPYERPFSLVYWEEEWLVGATLLPEILGQPTPRWSKIADFEPIFAGSASAITPSEKSSINAHRKSTTRFPLSLRWSSYVAPKSPKWGLKTQNGRFP